MADISNTLDGNRSHGLRRRELQLNRVQILESFLAGRLDKPASKAPRIVPWKEQSLRLWPEAQRFFPWKDVFYELAAETLADDAILSRLHNGRWSTLPPNVGRVIFSRLTQALSAIQVNEISKERPGIMMPQGIGDELLAPVLLVYWCYEMDLPLPESKGAASGRA